MKFNDLDICKLLIAARYPKIINTQCQTFQCYQQKILPLMWSNNFPQDTKHLHFNLS